MGLVMIYPHRYYIISYKFLPLLLDQGENKCLAQEFNGGRQQVVGSKPRFLLGFETTTCVMNLDVWRYSIGVDFRKSFMVPLMSQGNRSLFHFIDRLN